MKLIFPLLAAAGIGANFVQSGGKTALSTHEKTLKSAPSLKVSFTQQPLSGTPEPGSLAFNRPNQFRLDLGNRLLVCDGTSVTELDKKANTYSVVPFDGQFDKYVGGTPWGAFFVNEPFKTAKSVDAGSKRVIKGAQVLDVAVTLESGKVAHIYFDPKLGFARGWSNSVDGAEWIVLATEAQLGTAALAASEFAFTPPAGATKQEGPPPSAAPSYAAVNAIFMGNCMPCHGSNSPKGGYNMTSYAGVMRGSRSGEMVIPGNGKQSPLVKYLTGELKPRMPQNKPPLPPKMIETIIAWIDAGASK